jgi:ribosome-binding factor A
MKALARAAHFLRGEVGRALGLRVTPELRFEYDTVPDTARRLDDLLRRAARDEDKE